MEAERADAELDPIGTEGNQYAGENIMFLLQIYFGILMVVTN